MRKSRGKKLLWAKKTFSSRATFKEQMKAIGCLGNFTLPSVDLDLNQNNGSTIAEKLGGINDF